MAVKREKPCRCKEPRRTWHIYFLYITMPLIGFFIGMIAQQEAIKSEQYYLSQRTIQNKTNPSPSPASAVIYSLSPSFGPIGLPIIVSGTGFSKDQNYIVFGSGYIGPLESQNGRTLIFTLPDKATGGCNRPFNRSEIMCMALLLQTTIPGNSYDISVLTPNGQSNKLPFLVTTSR